MMRTRISMSMAAIMSGALALLAGCSAESTSGSDDAITIGVPVSLSGGSFSAYGKMTVEGLKAGVACSTDGTSEVDGRKIEFDVEDDGGDNTKSLTAATGMVGDGNTIIAGTTNSGAAVQIAEFAGQQDVLFISGAAGSDAMTGVNANAFRPTRQAYQEAAALTSVLDDKTGKVAVLAQDYEFGKGYVDTVEAILPDAEVEPILVPLDAKEFTPYARRVLDAKADLLIVVYYGDTSAAMWQSLQQQGALDSSQVSTLLVEKISWGIYGKGADKITFVTHYFPGAPGGEMSDCMLEHAPEADLSTHDGFVAGQMIVHALQEAGPDDVAGMVKALDGWTFEAPKGEMSIRQGDHAMLQDMFLVSLDGSSSSPVAKIAGTVPADETAPPAGSK